MGSPSPIPGRCGSPKKDKTFCTSWPLVGKERCKFHGGRATAMVKHNLSSLGFQAVYGDERLRARYGEIVDDPDLLDARRAVAVSQLALEHFPLQPTMAAVRALAWKLHMEGAAPRIGEGDGKPEELTEQEMDGALQILAAQLAAKGVEAAAGHARTVGIAWKQKKASELLLRGAIPVLQQLQVFIAQVLARPKHRIPIQTQREILTDVAQLAEQTRLALVKQGDDLDLEKG